MAEVIPLAVGGVGQDVAMSIDGSASARAKLARAIEHDRELRKLYESAGLKMSITRDPDLEPTDDPEVFLSNWRITEMDPIPTRWSCVAGDAIHNLRSALDHLAWHLALLDSDGDPYRYTSWPITFSPELFEGRAANVLKDLDDGHVAFVRERQPWFAEEFKALKWLRPLDDHDKHRLLLRMATSTTEDTFARIVSLSGCESAHVEVLFGVPVRPGDWLVRVRVVKPTEEFEYSLGYEFDPTVAFDGGPIASRAINRARIAVERVISDFEGQKFVDHRQR
jgi:hypothetical protein